MSHVVHIRLYKSKSFYGTLYGTEPIYLILMKVSTVKMPRTTTPLSDTEIKKSKIKDKTYKLSDGQGLYLVVKENGTKFFRYDYTFQNKRKSMSFGTYPEISLKDARIKRDETKKLLLCQAKRRTGQFLV